jgi:hypothetical protein
MRNENLVTRRVLIVTVLLTSVLRCLAAETETFKNVKIHRHKSAQDRALVDKVGTLTFDDVNRKFIFEKTREDRFDPPEKVEVPYDSITKVVFEVTSHMRGGAGALAAEFIPIAGGVASSAIYGQHVHDYWFYFEYKNGEESTKALLEVPKDSSGQVIEKASFLFGSRVSVTDFREEGEAIEPEKLPDIKSKQSLKVDKKDHPVPEDKPDKATIVVVCPPLTAFVPYSQKWNQFKLHANDRVVAVNREGTYSFAYLDPGKYRLVSQSENANGFEMELEAGKTYYFLQNTFEGVLKGHTALTRNSPELVTYLMNGTYFSNWSRKQ